MLFGVRQKYPLDVTEWLQKKPCYEMSDDEAEKVFVRACINESSLAAVQRTANLLSQVFLVKNTKTENRYVAVRRYYKKNGKFIYWNAVDDKYESRKKIPFEYEEWMMREYLVPIEVIRKEEYRSK